MDAPWSPKVSIVIPVYNGSNFLAQAITSALHQDYPHLEVLVINDGSKDNDATDAIARSFGSRIRYISKDNEGIAATLNRGIREMSGEYFSWLSHDDLFLPGKISHQVATLRHLDNKNSVIYGDYDLIDEHSAIIGERIIPHEIPERFYYSLFLRFPVHACTALFPKAAFEKVGGFDAKWKFLQDTDMWFRMAPFFPFVHVAEKFAQVRMHGEMGTITRAMLGYREANLLYRQELNRLSSEDIRTLMHQRPYKFYLTCASAFTVHSFFDAASLAVTKAGEALHDEPHFFQQASIPLRQIYISTLRQMQKTKHSVQRKMAVVKRQTMRLN